MRLRKGIALLALGLAGCGLWAAVPAKPQPVPAKKKPVAVPSKSRPLHRGATHTSARNTAARRSTVAAWRVGQMRPDTDRYKELQEALAKKGYLGREPSGVWDQESTDALRRFQKDQKLDPSGKLDSRTIIALGLGPKYSTPAEKPAPAQP